jgi:hypothetical protein
MPLARLFAATFLAALAGAAAVPSVAHATPCWKRVIDDWSKDGVITNHYSPRCLRQAIKHTPEDLRDYSPILDDINAALFDATGGRSGSNGPGNHGGSSGGAGAGGSSGSGPPDSGSMGPTGNPNSKSTGNGKLVVPMAGTADSAPSHSREVPLPLIVLGSVLLLATLAAASPPIYRRLRSRFPRPRAAADSVRPQS